MFKCKKAIGKRFCTGYFKICLGESNLSKTTGVYERKCEDCNTI